MQATLEREYISVNGLRLHVVLAGPAAGPTVVLLHGFPECWYGWHRQIDFLAAAGYRVVVPDQRGYNLSDKPLGVAAYDMEHLIADVLGLLDHLGRNRVALVGHDWGAAVAWSFALHHPDRLDRLAILNVPHPYVMQHALQTSLEQLRRSWYIFFFQLPLLPEWLLSRNGGKPLAGLLKASSRPGTFSDDTLARYHAAWAQPGSIKAMLHWYRAAFRRRLKASAAPARVMVPTLMLWGAQDVALSRWLAPRSIALCDQGRLIFIEEASHWLQHEEADRVNALLGAFLRTEALPRAE